VDAAIDFSMPGRFVLPFDQTCSSSHGETVVLRVPPEALLGTTITQLLAGLNAKLEIADKSGSITKSAVSQVIWGEETLDGAIPIFGISPFRKGAYKATVTVIEGAPALNGITQRLEGRYLLCGLEQLPGTIVSGIGIVSAGIGSLVGVIAMLLAARDRRNHHSGPKGDPPDGGLETQSGNSGLTEQSPSES
jgi:hypothetical protein